MVSNNKDGAVFVAMAKPDSFCSKIIAVLQQT